MPPKPKLSTEDTDTVHEKRVPSVKQTTTNRSESRNIRSDLNQTDPNDFLGKKSDQNNGPQNGNFSFKPGRRGNVCELPQKGFFFRKIIARLFFLSLIACALRQSEVGTQTPKSGLGYNISCCVFFPICSCFTRHSVQRDLTWCYVILSSMLLALFPQIPPVRAISSFSV